MGSEGHKAHLISFAVEDYFHASALGGLTEPRHWTRLETRVERSTLRALDLLDARGVKATFFALGWVAEHMPEVIRRIVDRGHEVAAQGYLPRAIGEMTPGEFREDVLRSREAIERAAGREVLGYRIARGSLALDELWALDILAEEGFRYDSSIYPRLRSISGEPWRRFVHEHRARDRSLWEIPLSAWGLGGWHLPASGGSAFRQSPHALMKRGVQYWHDHYDSPFNLYFHVWELDPDLPRIASASGFARLRQYRNLDKVQEILADYLRSFRFMGIGAWLGLEARALSPSPAPSPGVSPGGAPAPTAAGVPGELYNCTIDTPGIEAASEGPGGSDASAMPVAIVVPFYEEEGVLAYFANTLAEIEEDFRGRYQPSFVFVDDGSSDGTWAELTRIFGGRPGCRLVRHERNQGVAAAIMTGIRHAEAEIVCSIDCDCTYDPRHLLSMIPLLGPGIDLVTASPYHPQGRVRSVPASRLLLSRTLSRMYSLALSERFYTYTSCCRVYRRSAVVDLELENGGFLGVAELLIALKMDGRRIVEHPATLESRVLGQSKMKIARTVAGHLGLLTRVAAEQGRRRASTFLGAQVQ